MHCHLLLIYRRVLYSIHFDAGHTLFIVLELRDSSGRACCAHLPDEAKRIDLQLIHKRDSSVAGGYGVGEILCSAPNAWIQINGRFDNHHR